MTTISHDDRPLESEMAELVAEVSPRRFALCWLDRDERDGGILY